MILAIPPTCPAARLRTGEWQKWRCLIEGREVTLSEAPGELEVLNVLCLASHTLLRVSPPEPQASPCTEELDSGRKLIKEHIKHILSFCSKICTELNPLGKQRQE